MTEQTYESPEEEQEPSKAPDNPDLAGLDSSGRDRSADYSVDQAQAHRNADEGRETPYTTSDPG
jgi:hypothetical protein